MNSKKWVYSKKSISDLVPGIRAKVQGITDINEVKKQISKVKEAATEYNTALEAITTSVAQMKTGEIDASYGNQIIRNASKALAGPAKEVYRTIGGIVESTEAVTTNELCAYKGYLSALYGVLNAREYELAHNCTESIEFCATDPDIDIAFESALKTLDHPEEASVMRTYNEIDAAFEQTMDLLGSNTSGRSALERVDELADDGFDIIEEAIQTSTDWIDACFESTTTNDETTDTSWIEEACSGADCDEDDDDDVVADPDDDEDDDEVAAECESLIVDLSMF